MQVFSFYWMLLKFYYVLAPFIQIWVHIRDCRNLFRIFTFTNSMIIDTAILVFHTVI